MKGNKMNRIKNGKLVKMTRVEVATHRRDLAHRDNCYALAQAVEAYVSPSRFSYEEIVNALRKRGLPVAGAVSER